MNRQGRDSCISLSSQSVRAASAAGFAVSEHRQSGVTLIEVLVTLLLVSIGLVGSLALQARAMQDNQSAYLRSQAVNMATDIADRIRLNPIGARANRYNIDWSKQPADFKSDSNNLADRDLNSWLSWLKTGLGSRAAAQIQRSGDTYTVDIRWHDQRNQRVNNQGAQQGPQFSTFRLQLEL